MPSTRSPASVPPDGPGLSLSGTRLSVTRRTSSVSPVKLLTRSVSVSVAGDGPARRNPPRDAASEKSPRSVKNLRRSNSTDLSSSWSLGSLRPVFTWQEPGRDYLAVPGQEPGRDYLAVPGQEPGRDYLAVPGQEPGRDYLALFDSGSDGRKKLASLSKMSADTTTWNVLNDQPRASLPPQSGPGGAGSPRTKESRKRREERKEPCFALAATFTANNRSNKAAVGNSVTTILHNNYSEKPLTPKSSNQSPSFNNILKANDEVPPDGGSLTKSQKNFSSSSGCQQRREVSEEEAERFVQQVNQAAVAIQRWFRRHRGRNAARRKDGRDRTAQDGRPEQNRKDEDRKRIREEKARLARIAAVQELQQSRRPEKSPPATTSTAPPADIKTTNTDSNVKVLSGRTEPGSRTVSPPPAQRSQEGGAQEQEEEEEEEERQDGHRKKVRRPRACLAEELQPDSPQPAAASGRKKPLKIVLSSNSPASPGSRGPTAPPADPADPRRTSDSNRNVVLDRGELGPGAASPPPSTRRGSQEVLQDQRPGTALHQLLDTLKLLEAEPEPQSYCKEKYWTDPVLQSVSPQDADSNSLTAHNLERHGRLSLHPAPPDGGALLSEAKLQSIISFLDEMEKSELDRPRSAASGSHREAVLSEEEPPGAAEQLSAVMRVKTELEEKRRSVSLLQAALAQQRELTLRQAKETERELNRGYQQQKEQYEATIQRHLAFIDQLISDKKSLSERCGGVLAELQQVDQKYMKKMSQMQEQHEMEIKKLKDLMSATEKVRREKWIEEKTKKIKEITVKGLEPEIQKLISKHKQELKKLRTLHEAELLQADQRAAQRYVRQSEELRQQLEAEKEEECRRERELAKQRFEKQLQEEELSLQQQRNRLYKDVSDEKNRLAQLAAWQRSELDDLRRQLEENSSLAGRVLREELDRTREEQERRHQEEMKALQERLDIEKQTWEESYKKKEEAWLLSRERELKDELRRERDKEIERAIWALEEETSRDKEECERAADGRMQRAKQQFQEELQELQRSERAAVEKHRQLRKQQAETEEELLRLQAALRHKQQETQDVKEDRDKLAEERRRLADVIREEFAERLVATEEENRRLKAEGAELRARLRMEVETLSRQKEEELAQVHHRVKSAILKKEEIVSTLRKQHEAAVKRADHLEALWEQQRKQLLEK